ncbi:MAG: hypothetical protein ABJK25_15130 [Halieaceae bacterium]
MPAAQREFPLQNLFEDYMHAFAEKRYDDVAQMFSFPTLLCQPDSVMEITSAEMVAALMQKLRITLADDYATTHILRDEVSMLDDSLGALHGIYERRNAKGEMTSQGQGLYMMRYDGADWKMCGITVMATPKV